jgi:tRNA A-37 threonylcarbamoyl transferase component Bud32
MEHKILKNHRDQCNCNILVTPEGDSITVEKGLCGYVMKPVGQYSAQHQLKDGIKKDLLKKILLALFALHTHKPPILHGDPRLPNLIVNTNGDYFWVDLMAATESAEGLNYGIFVDMNKLIKNIFHDDDVKEDVKKTLLEYSQSPNVQTLEGLFCALCLYYLIV